MKNFLKVVVSLVILVAIWYQFGDSILARFIPCKNPISYTLGIFDTKFGISKSYFLSALRDAEAIWEKPFGKELFQYKAKNDEGGENKNDLKINLIYDYRQDATKKLESIGIVVENNKASYDMLKLKLESLKTEYAKTKSAFEVQIEAFNQKKLAYESEVESWNKQGGAPKNEYDKLEAERLALNAESVELQNAQKRINEMVAEINALVVALNRLVDSLNLSVEKYNTTNDSRGESFEEGVYSSDSITREIDIYEFSSRTKLVRVLTHELGHALGLDHVEDPKAIMYKLNQGDNQALTATDLAALKVKCGGK